MPQVRVQSSGDGVWGSIVWHSDDTLEPLQFSCDAARQWIESHFQDLMQSVVEAVDAETGGWWRIMDQPGKEGNYIESSASAMLVYSLMKGVWVGVLETKACVDVAVKAWAY
tara:strand:+ start:244 stop:579 length:336 start_codon:yes stop_codon:yes gene_type:complete